MTPGRIRSALFTPGTEATRLQKAAAGDADVCIFDLEDSVPPDRVAEARGIVAASLEAAAGKRRIWVRVHAADSSAMPDDVAALPLEKADGVVLPKVGGAADLATCRSAILAAKGPANIPLIPIVESAAGVVNVSEIATAPNVLCLAFGRFDLAADLGIDPDGGSPVFAAARAAVILHSAAAGLQRPLDAPWLAIKDLDGLRGFAERSRADGFGGMLVIHPTHVAPVNHVFSPTADEVAWARDIVASAEQSSRNGRGAYTKDGAMVDEAIVRRARAILEATAS
jgi:citrate lyase beta subunit